MQSTTEIRPLLNEGILKSSSLTSAGPGAWSRRRFLGSLERFARLRLPNRGCACYPPTFPRSRDGLAGGLAWVFRTACTEEHAGNHENDSGAGADQSTKAHVIQTSLLSRMVRIVNVLRGRGRLTSLESQRGRADTRVVRPDLAVPSSDKASTTQGARNKNTAVQRGQLTPKGLGETALSKAVERPAKPGQ
jgi:hypothetical protein